MRPIAATKAACHERKWVTGTTLPTPCTRQHSVYSRCSSECHQIAHRYSEYSQGYGEYSQGYGEYSQGYGEYSQGYGEYSQGYGECHQIAQRYTDGANTYGHAVPGQMWNGPYCGLRPVSLRPVPT
jgi:hypothetical protein